MVNRPDGIIPIDSHTARFVASLLSPEHAREVWDLSGLSPEDAVSASLAVSVEAFALLCPVTSDPLFLMGVEASGKIAGGALVWMLGTNRTSVFPRRMLRAVKWGLDRAFAVSGADRIEQFIPSWYDDGLRFVEHLGFELLPMTLRGRSGSSIWSAVLCRERWEELKDVSSGRRGGFRGKETAWEG
jgi:hypothetical protein